MDNSETKVILPAGSSLVGDHSRKTGTSEAKVGRGEGRRSEAGGGDWRMLGRTPPPPTVAAA